MLDDVLLLEVVEDINRKFTRKSYEKLLVDLDLFLLSTLKDNDELSGLTKYDLILETLRSIQYQYEIIYGLYKRHQLSKELYDRLVQAGIDFGEETTQSGKVQPTANPKNEPISVEHEVAVSVRNVTRAEDGSERKRSTARNLNSKTSRLTRGQMIAIVIPITVAVIGLLGVLITNWEKIRDNTQETEYVGRVINSNSLQPIVGAKVTLDLRGAPHIAYTDSEGIYQLKIAIISNASGQIRVDAQGYQVYTRNITIFSETKIIEDIRLNPLEVNVVSTQTIFVIPTANSTLVSMYDHISTPNPKFIPEIRTTDGIEQAWIPEGSFVAGDVSGIGYDDEKPLHIVYTDDFWIDRNLVTNSEYATCPEAICGAPQKLTSHARPNGYYNVAAYGNYPVISISWQQATNYCIWRNGRLPTEAEFEKAAGWDPTTNKTSVYPWGDAAPTGEYANFNGIDRDTRPVGSYPQGMSPTGAYDMAGNVWEWISDWYAETHYADNHVWNNPTGPADGIYKVIKGGSWFSNDMRWLRVSNRGKSVPDKAANEIGFRCVYEK